MTAEKSGEFRGKTVEAAISVGLATLGLSRDDVEVEVVRPGSRGLLGIGAEDAVVRVTALRSAPAEPPRTAPKVEPVPPSKAEPAPAARQETRQAPRQESRQSPHQETKQSSKPRQPAQAAATQPAAPAAAADARELEAIEVGRDLLAGLLERMNLRAMVEIVPQSEAESDEDQDDNTMVLNIVGDDLGVLIGRQSEVLSSLQFITRLMVNQKTHSRTNLIIDVNGYKAKRAESLRKLALRTAEQVMQTGRTMSLEPMPPAERRIIHLALRNHQSVATQSVGEGSRRKVTVVLKKQ